MSKASAIAELWSAMLSTTSRARKPSAIRALQPLVSLPHMISLGGGMPNPALFPFKGMSLTIQDDKSASGFKQVEVPQADVAAALQYSPTPGLPELVHRLTHMQVCEHAPPNPVSVLVVPGSQDGLAKIFDALLEREDTLLVEGPTYSGSLAYLEALGCGCVPVAVDGDGLRPDALERVLREWKPAVQGKKPKALYTIPTGSNPTGASLTLERKKRIYDIAREHNIVIIEDDPYYYLTFDEKRTPSFLSMDVDGRVVRTDSFSKVLAAGLRLGFVTGPEPIVSRIALHNQASILHTSGVSQLFALMLCREWGVGESGSTGAAGLGRLADHVVKIREFYKKQCDAFMASAHRHLTANEDGTGPLLAEFSRPTAGMFVWMKLHGVDDTFSLITKEAVEKKVLMVPGSAFFPGNPKTPYVRAAFSTASPEELDTALSRFGSLLRERARVRGAV